MIYLNEQLYQLKPEQNKEFSKEHIWTVPPEQVTWDKYNLRITVPLRAGVPCLYRVNAPMTGGTEKKLFTVRYATNVYGDKAGRDVFTPIQIFIEKGVLFSTDAELNYYLFHSPFAVGGKTYTAGSTSKRLCNLYKRMTYVAKSETKATRLVKIITRINEMDATELVAAAKGVIHLNPLHQYFKINEQKLADPETRAEELFVIHMGMLEMAQKQLDAMDGILSRDETALFKIIQKCLDEGLLFFDGENPTAGFSGKWVINISGGKKDVCTVNDKTPKMDTLFSFLHDPKNEQKRLLVTKATKELEPA